MVVPTNPSTKKRKIVASNNSSTKKRKMEMCNLDTKTLLYVLELNAKLSIFCVAIELGIHFYRFDISPEILEEILEKIREKSQEIYESLIDFIKKVHELCEFYKNIESKEATPSITKKLTRLNEAEDEAKKRLENVLNRRKNNGNT
jgi:uncharacterized protein (DUF2164 family)